MRGTSRQHQLKPGGRKACRCKSCLEYHKTKKKAIEVKSKPVDARLFVLPYVVLPQKIRMAPIGPFGLENDAQKRLEEIALLARWRRKHQPIILGSRSADRQGAACKSKTGKLRRASR